MGEDDKKKRRDDMQLKRGESIPLSFSEASRFKVWVVHTIRKAPLAGDLS